MATYYVDPSIESAGNGLSEGAAFKYYSSLTTPFNTGNHTVMWKMGAGEHRPAATLPAISAANVLRVVNTSSANLTFDTYGTGDAVEVTGAVVWPGAVGTTTLNNFNCITLAAGQTVDPFWFPRSAGRASYPSLCAPTGDDAVDSFMVSAAAFDDIAPGAAGVRYVPASRYGGTTDATKEVSYSGSAGNYTVKIIAPGFWARANAVVPLVGHKMVMRTGANFTDYFCTILTYDAGGGFVTVSATSAPSNGTQGLFFYALFAHQYGVRLNRQYAMQMTSQLPTGWVVAFPDEEIDVVCYGTMFRFSGGGHSFDDTVTWKFTGAAHGNSAAYGGCGIETTGIPGLTIGDVEGRQLRNFARAGGPVHMSGAGDLTNTEVGSISVYESMGVKAIECSSTGTSGGPNSFPGPIYSEEGGGGIRVSGGGSGITISDGVIAPRASVHDNAVNVYGEAKNVTLTGIVAVGAVNPFATQRDASTNTSTNRDIINCLFSGRPKIDRSGWDTNATLRHDNGGKDGLYDRVLAFGGGSGVLVGQSSSAVNTGLVFRRCVLEYLYSGSGAGHTGTHFQDCVLVGKSPSVTSGTVLDYIVSKGGTHSGCIEISGTFPGSLTDDMWNKLTLDDAGTGHEDVDPWLAPQLGLVLKAYGSTRTLVAPKFIHVPFRVGHQAGVMYGALINPNPLSTMTLPAGLGDNDKLDPDLFGGINVLPSVACPDQSTFQVVVRVTDAGATNGPYQDFTYNIDIQSFADGTTYGPFTLSVTDDVGTTVALPEFSITVQA